MFSKKIHRIWLWALPLLWCYRGQQGHHSKAFRWFSYAFYPGHMLLLWLLTPLLFYA